MIFTECNLLKKNFMLIWKLLGIAIYKEINIKKNFDLARNNFCSHIYFNKIYKNIYNIYSLI